ncbi:MAG: putative LPS assembly protein LptD [Fidelibacterota bacterium]
MPGKTPILQLSVPPSLPDSSFPMLQFSIVLLLLSSALSGLPPDRLHLIHADELENITSADGKAVQYLRGNVKFQKGKAILTSDRAYYRQRDATASFVDSVRMDHGEQTLTVDSLTFESRLDRITGYGGVRFDDPEYRLTSDSLIYFLEADSGIASGNVHFTQKNQVITSQYLTYRKRENDTAASYTASGNVVIVEDNRRATCEKSLYNATENFSILKGNPIVVQDRQTLTGDEIQLYYQEEALRRVVIPGEAHIVYETRGKVPVETGNPHPDTTAYELKDFTDEMNGERLEAYLVDGSLDSVRLEGMATTLYHLFSEGPTGEDSVYQGKNFASGDTITLRFDPDSAHRGDLRRVRLVGGSRGEYHPHEGTQDIKAPVLYRAHRIDYDIPNEKTTLVRKARIDYQNTRLEAGWVTVTWEDNLLRAFPSADPSEPVDPEDFPTILEKGRNPMVGQSLIYDLSTGRGKVTRGKTRMEDGYYTGKEIRNQTEDIFFVENSRYTTCNLDPDPHFHFQSRRLKMIVKDKIIARPIVLYIAGIPVFGLPFGVFPDQSGKRHSGWIMPSYGENARQGQYLRGLGYFWAANDFLNSRFSLDFYDKQGIVFTSRNNYVKRYAFRGGLNFRYNRKIATGDIADIISNPNRVDWSLSWNHDHKLRYNQSFRVSGQYFSSNDFNRRLGIERQTRLNQTTTSRAYYSKRWPGPGINMSASLSENRNLMAREKIDSTSIYYAVPTRKGERITENTFVVPTANFRKERVQLFGGGPGKRGGPSLYWSYNSTLANRGVTFYESDSSFAQGGYTWGPRQQELGSKWIHSMSISGSQRLFEHIAVSQGLSIQEKWISRYFDASIVDTLGRFPDKRELQGFKARHEFAFSMSANTKLYGIFPLRIESLRAVRHTLTPSVSFSYVPDYSKPFFGYDFGYVRKLTDEQGRTHLFDPFAGTQIGSTPLGERRNLNIQIKNSFQAKIREGDKERKTSSFLTWNMNTGYNFVAEKFKWSKLTSRIRANIPRLFTLDISMVHDFYELDVSGDKPSRVNRIATTSWGIPSPRLTTVRASTGFQISGYAWRRPGEESTPLDTTAVDTTLRPEDLTEMGLEEREAVKKSALGTGKLWKAGVSFSYRISRENPLNPISNFWMGFNMKLNASKSWRVQYSARFDLLERSITSHDFRIYRDLHCWELIFTWTPGGFGRGYYLRVNVKAPSLKDLKLESWGGRYGIAGY